VIQPIDSHTICAISTGSGSAALALIRLSGHEALSIANRCFSKDILNADGYTVHYGAIKKESEIIDDVVLTVFRGPKSFTGEDIVEIACHGSSYIQQEIINLLLESGASMATPGEFSKRAFFNGKMDLSQTEAIADLIHSTSKAAHDIAINQMRGGFSKELKELREKLIEFASLIELELDFSEEDVEFADRSELEKLISELIQYVDSLAGTFKYGNAIKNGVQVVIAGRPNAGKSSLLNAFLNEDRAIVSDIPGTTRDTIEEVITIKGIDFRLIDTAGIREAKDQIEKIGVERTMQKIEQSAIMMFMFEEPELINNMDVEGDLNEIGFSRENLVLLANKTDLKNSNQTLPEGSIQISTWNKEDIEKVKETLYSTFLKDQSILENTVVTNARHYEALIKAKGDLQKVETGMQSGISGDLLAMDIRQALFHTGSILGEVSTDDLLENIFLNFCIGK